jgi:hypothetical protein
VVIANLCTLTDGRYIPQVISEPSMSWFPRRFGLQCVPLADAAAAAGLTSLVDAVAAVVVRKSSSATLRDGPDSTFHSSVCFVHFMD